MPKEKQKNKLPPFEQNIKNIKDFHDNMKMFESAVLMTEAAKALNLVSDADEEGFSELDEMLKSTIVSFSEYIEERGGSWN